MVGRLAQRKEIWKCLSNGVSDVESKNTHAKKTPPKSRTNDVVHAVPQNHTLTINPRTFGNFSAVLFGRSPLGARCRGRQRPEERQIPCLSAPQNILGHFLWPLPERNARAHSVGDLHRPYGGLENKSVKFLLPGHSEGATSGPATLDNRCNSCCVSNF